VPKQTTRAKFFENLCLSFKNFVFSKFQLSQKYLVLIPAGMGHFIEYGMWNGQNRGIYGINGMELEFQHIPGTLSLASRLKTGNTE
jgi:hypothetical protein